MDLLVASGEGLIIATREGQDWWEVRRGLPGRRVTSVIAREGVILAGTGQGVWRSDDLGQTWVAASAGLSLPYVRWLAFHPNFSDLEFAGTEPASIFVSHDGAQTWRECPEVGQMRDHFGWWLPYSPGAGCVRGFAFHGDRVYAAVEVGGVLRSDDRGETWRLVDGCTGQPVFTIPSPTHCSSDIHSVETLAAFSPDLVFAATNSGLFRSMDGGATWSHLFQCYCRAVWINPTDPNHIILGPADRTDRIGRIEVSQDGGQTWRLASDGLDAPWPRHMVERFVRVEDELVAVLSNGEVFAAPLATLAWRRILSGVTNIEAVTTMAA